MALFKILRGDSSRISPDVTPFHDGYAYFTQDDGGFYIDSEVNGQQNRHRVNPRSTILDTTLAAGGWVDGVQTLEFDQSGYQNGFIHFSNEITPGQIYAAMQANLTLQDQSEGHVTIVSEGITPTCDIPVTIVLFP